MGLGKTLQALAFLAWLREVSAWVRQSGGPKGPVIIVAPTGLLANWEKEHNLHLHEPGLGDICRAYGRHLKNLKISNTRDIDRGVRPFRLGACYRSWWRKKRTPRHVEIHGL